MIGRLFSKEAIGGLEAIEILFRTRKMEKACSSEKESKRTWGKSSPVLRQRVAELAAAETLADMTLLPAARCHQLKGDRVGQFAVDLKHPHRLIFEPVNNPLPRKEDGSVDLEKITTIYVLEVVDYHGD